MRTAVKNSRARWERAKLLAWLSVLVLTGCSQQPASEPPPLVRTIVVDHACSGFKVYRGDLTKVQPKEARVHLAEEKAFGAHYCGESWAIGKKGAPSS